VRRRSPRRRLRKRRSAGASGVVEALRAHADAGVAAQSRRYFRSGAAGRTDGDVFWGVSAPILRALAREHAGLSRRELEALLVSEVHEQRALALLVLGDRFARGDAAERRSVHSLYRKHLSRVNNWDLVDASAYRIEGEQLVGRSRRPLYLLARSPDLWRRRAAIVATFAFIRRGDFDDTLRLAELLLNDAEDLVHKAIGWMLREVAKRDRGAVEAFLRRHYDRVPRTTLRYAIERFPGTLRRRFLAGAFPPPAGGAVTRRPRTRAPAGGAGTRSRS
jgi:3-methyladenine DNA glycosylase AlkD